MSAKLMEAYRSLGTILRTYKSGKLPKIFKILPNIQKWEEVVPYSLPE
jgi:essential nuclear protein 1